jgi:hypothetical protein
MSAVYSELETTFTTADTVGPVSISFSGAELTVTFANFRTPVQTVMFYDVRAFSWSGWDGTSPEISPDRIYVVSGSSFLAPWIEFSASGDQFVHFKLGFNAEGKYLDVIARRMEYKGS